MTRTLFVWAVAVGLGLSGACDRAASVTTATQSPQVAGTAEPLDPASVQAEAFVHAAATGATADDAYGAAVEGLAVAVFGDAAWVTLKPVTVHDRAGDLVAIVEHGPAQFEATVGLTRARAAAVLSGFEVTDPRIDAPKAWRDVLYAFVYAHAAVVVCERRRALFDGACEPTETADADAGLKQLATGLTLVPAHAGGVPLDADRRPLRQPAVYAMWNGVPAQGVPLLASASEPAVPQPVRTDAQGRAALTVADTAWERPLHVSVDTASLLGPLHEAWPQTEIELVGRPTDVRRWSMLVTDRSKRLDDDAPFVKALAARMRRQGLGDPVAIDPAAAKRVLNTPAPKRDRAVATLADALGGRLDVLLVIDIRSEFANRMGGSRVWYEARAGVDAHDAWTGRVLTRLDVSETASGVGDERADAAARRKAAETVVEQILQDENIPRPKLPEATHNARLRPDALEARVVARTSNHSEPGGYDSSSASSIRMMGNSLPNHPVVRRE